MLLNNRILKVVLPSDGWMREFNVTLPLVRPNRQAGTTVMRRMAFVDRMKLPSNMTAPELNPIEMRVATN